jgi:predicted RNA-binding Zn-ribbon protein involved in translation (DUF1610 family)
VSKQVSKQKKRAQCIGSGREVPIAARARWSPCPVCGRGVDSRSGNYRAHIPWYPKAEGFKQMTPEQRAAWGRKIAEGLRRAYNERKARREAFVAMLAKEAEAKAKEEGKASLHALRAEQRKVRIANERHKVVAIRNGTEVRIVAPVWGAVEEYAQRQASMPTAQRQAGGREMFEGYENGGGV